MEVVNYGSWGDQGTVILVTYKVVRSRGNAGVIERRGGGGGGCSSGYQRGETKVVLAVVIVVLISKLVIPKP